MTRVILDQIQYKVNAEQGAIAEIRKLKWGVNIFITVHLLYIIITIIITFFTGSSCLKHMSNTSSNTRWYVDHWHAGQRQNLNRVQWDELCIEISANICFLFSLMLRFNILTMLG